MAKSISQLRREYDTTVQRLQVYQSQGINLQQQLQMLSCDLSTVSKVNAYRSTLQKYNTLANKVRASEMKLNTLSNQIAAYDRKRGYIY